MPADPRLLTDAAHATPADSVNAATPTPVDHLDRAREHVLTDHLSELERLAHAAGELYGDALRDQLHRAIADLGSHMDAARVAIRYARTERDDHLTRLCSAVEEWAADYRRIDSAYQETAERLVAAERRLAGIVLAAGEPGTEPQPATPPAMPEANLGVARTRELLDELLARLDGRKCSYPRVDEVAAVIESAAAELPGDVLDYRTIDS